MWAAVVSEKIYMQYSEDGTGDHFESWCNEQQHDNDVAYVPESDIDDLKKENLELREAMKMPDMVGMTHSLIHQLVKDQRVKLIDRYNENERLRKGVTEIQTWTMQSDCGFCTDVYRSTISLLKKKE